MLSKFELQKSSILKYLQLIGFEDKSSSESELPKARDVKKLLNFVNKFVL